MIQVFVVDPCESARAEVCDLLAGLDDIRVVGQAPDGAEAMRYIDHHPVDVVITELVMPHMDGFSLMDALCGNSVYSARVVVLTCVNTESFIQRAARRGATQYLLKPARGSELIARLREMECAGDTPRAALSVGALNAKLSSLFLSIGIPAHIHGFPYLREAVRMVVLQPDTINRITKELYPRVARMQATSSSKVERAIRHAIDVAWTRGRVEIINEIFGCRAVLPNVRPSNGEFIALVADRIINSPNTTQSA